MTDIDCEETHNQCHLCDSQASMNKCSHCNYILCDSCYHNYFVLYKNIRCPHCRLNFHNQSDNILNNIEVIVSDNDNVRGILVFQRRPQMTLSFNLDRLSNISICEISKILLIISMPIVFILILYSLGMIIMVYLFKSNTRYNIYINLLIGFMVFTVFYLAILIPSMIIFPERCKKIHIFLSWW